MANTFKNHKTETLLRNIHGYERAITGTKKDIARLSPNPEQVGGLHAYLRVLEKDLAAIKAELENRK